MLATIVIIIITIPCADGLSDTNLSWRYGHYYCGGCDLALDDSFGRRNKIPGL